MDHEEALKNIKEAIELGLEVVRPNPQKTEPIPVWAEFNLPRAYL